MDADGLIDIVFTQRIGGPNFWRNTGGAAERFVRETLPGVAAPAYAMAWGDLNGDGSLDLVTGSYDASLLAELGNSFLLNNSAGVYFYANCGGTFSPTRLAPKSQALAITQSLGPDPVPCVPILRRRAMTLWWPLTGPHPLILAGDALSTPHALLDTLAGSPGLLLNSGPILSSSQDILQIRDALSE